MGNNNRPTNARNPSQRPKVRTLPPVGCPDFSVKILFSSLSLSILHQNHDGYFVPLQHRHHRHLSYIAITVRIVSGISVGAGHRPGRSNRGFKHLDCAGNGGFGADPAHCPAGSGQGQQHNVAVEVVTGSGAGGDAGMAARGSTEHILDGGCAADSGRLRPKHFSPGLPWVACTEGRGAHSGRHRDDRPDGRSSPCLRTSGVAKHSASTFLRMQPRDAAPAGSDHARSKRSRFMTLFHAAMKSHTNACCESSQA